MTVPNDILHVSVESFFSREIISINKRKWPRRPLAAKKRLALKYKTKI